MIAEICSRYLKWFRIAGELNQVCHPNADRVSAFGEIHLEFSVYLARIGVHAIGEYEKYVGRFGKKVYRGSDYRIGSRISVDAASVALDLRANISGIYSLTIDKTYKLEWWGSIHTLHLCYKLDKQFESWMGECVRRSADGYDRHKASRKSFRGITRSRMIYLISRHQFPALGRLYLMKAFVDDEALNLLSWGRDKSSSVEDKGDIHRDRYLEIVSVFEEMLKETERLDSPVHFTPSMLAETAAVLSVLSDVMPKELEDRVLTTKTIAREKIILAQQSIGMGRQYYRAISSLYYLYDDFDDRRLHLGHAMQMAGSDLSERLKRVLDD